MTQTYPQQHLQTKRSYQVGFFSILLIACYLTLSPSHSLHATTSPRICFAPLNQENGNISYLSTRTFTDSEHASIALGKIFPSADSTSAWIPYAAVGYSFFPTGPAWETGLMFCHKNYTIRLGYEGKASLPLPIADGENTFIQAGYLNQEFYIHDTRIAHIIKFGQSWEFYRQDSSSPYRKKAFPTIETGFIFTIPLIRLPRFQTILYEYSFLAYLIDLNEWTLNSFLVLDSTFLKRKWGETKAFLKFIHTYSSDRDHLLESRSAFFLSSYPLNRNGVPFYNDITAGYLAGTVALGQRFFPFRYLSKGQSWKNNIYFAPYITYGAGLAHNPAGDTVSDTFGAAVYLGLDMPQTYGALSVAIGFNNYYGLTMDIFNSF